MILVDTSVLINYFKGANNEKVNRFDIILAKKIPFGINQLIYLELLQGAANEKEYTKLDEYLSTQNYYELTGGFNSYRKCAQMYMKCRRNGITIRSTVDLLIAQTAIDNNLYLLHDDKDFTMIAKVNTSLQEW